MSEVDFSDLQGRAIVAIDGLTEGSEMVTLTTACGYVYKMFHEQDCRETVALHEVTGSDPADLLGATVSIAEESTRAGDEDEWGGTSTWTFYRIVTPKGSLQLRWLGESNGYYSESVTVTKEIDPYWRKANGDT